MCCVFNSPSFLHLPASFFVAVAAAAAAAAERNMKFSLELENLLRNKVAVRCYEHWQSSKSAAAAG